MPEWMKELLDKMADVGLPVELLLCGGAKVHGWVEETTEDYVVILDRKSGRGEGRWHVSAETIDAVGVGTVSHPVMRGPRMSDGR